MADVDMADGAIAQKETGPIGPVHLAEALQLRRVND
jgi:hypothetical protein